MWSIDEYGTCDRKKVKKQKKLYMYANEGKLDKPSSIIIVLGIKERIK